MRRLALLVLLLVIAAGCSFSDGGGSASSSGQSSTSTLPEIDGAGDEAARLEAARVRWEAAAIDDYTWSFTRLCFCPVLSAEVRVEDGEAVTESIDVEFGEADELDFATMDELLSFLAREIEDSDDVTVEYDAETGRVLRFDADRIAEAVDDELGYQVDSFVPADQRRPDLSDVELTESYPCGRGFQGSNAAQTVGVTLEIDPAGGRPPAVTTLPDPQWTATLLRGEHLFANWCNDLVQPGTPERRVAESLPIVAGTITIERPVPAFDHYGAEVTATLTDLVVEQPDGTRIDLPDAELVNESWGGAAG
ncbi:MAG: hypothetical protein JNK12_06780 [Acidimicrobiales bacterium]|nr:hypothetical protein [Acidimicrobiales bacterium]